MTKESSFAVHFRRQHEIRRLWISTFVG